MASTQKTTVPNLIAEHPLFVGGVLHEEFSRQPLGFVDVGSAGGAHPMIQPVAPLVHCLLFEPNPGQCQQIYRAHNQGEFAGLTVCNFALGGCEGRRRLHLTRSEVNSSLLEPDPGFLQRYRRMGFEVANEIEVTVKTLDQVVQEASNSSPFSGEFIKLDCQGAEYEILEGAKITLAEHCVALWCEVEFFTIYRGQPTFADVDRLLRPYGFVPYGLYPNYISQGLLDRRCLESNERLMWADILYVKDPLDPLNADRKLPLRSWLALMLIALSLNYFDLALELAQNSLAQLAQQEQMAALIRALAKEARQKLEENARGYMANCSRDPEGLFLYTKKFIDQNTANNNLDLVRVD